MREHRQRRVVAHRTHRFALVTRQYANDFIALFGGDIEHLAIDRQRRSIKRLCCQRGIEQIGFEVLHALLEPCLIGMARLEQVVDRSVLKQIAGLQIQRQHLAGAHAALTQHIFRCVIPHTHFRGDGQMAILGNDIASRTQAVAIQRASHIAAIGQHHAGRAIPRLHVRCPEFIEGAQIRIDAVDRLPCRGHEQAHGMHDIQAAHDQQLEHVVDALRVGTGQGHQRQDVVQIRQQRRLEDSAAGLCPVAVGLDGVDLAVMRQQAERMRQTPLRQRVGREALVEHRHRRFNPRIVEVFEELGEMLRHHHALVDNGAGRQAGQIEHRIDVLTHLLGAATRQEQLAVEGFLVHVIVRRVDIDLLDQRQGLDGLDTAGIGVDGQQAPTGHLQTLALQLLLQLGAVAGSNRSVLIHEHQARGKLTRQLETSLGSGGTQKGHGRFEQQAATIARLAVGSDSAAMGQSIEGDDCRFDQPVAGLVIKAGNEAKTATVLFVGFAVQTLIVFAVHQTSLWGRHVH